MILVEKCSENLSEGVVVLQSKREAARVKATTAMTHRQKMQRFNRHLEMLPPQSNRSYRQRFLRNFRSKITSGVVCPMDPAFAKAGKKETDFNL